jgi:hypothetical protein
LSVGQKGSMRWVIVSNWLSFTNPIYHRLSMDYDALMNEAMNLAHKRDRERRGLNCAHTAHKRFAQEGGISCV